MQAFSRKFSLAFFVLVIVILLSLHGLKKQPITTNLKIKLDDQHTINVYDKNKNTLAKVDLNRNLISQFKDIKCKESLAYKELRPVFCVHDIKTDGISNELWSDKAYEGEILNKVIEKLNNPNKDVLFLDIGANIGAYSLVIAKMGYKVFAIEAFRDNVLRIHKACYLAKSCHNLVLIYNALSNKRNEIKMLHPHENIGAQSLLPLNNQNFTRDVKNKYLVETILFDDIMPYLPYKHDNKPFKKAVVKIDIEGFEPFAFQHASKLFDSLDIPIVYMEWYNIKKLDSNIVEPLIEFFTKRNYECFNGNGGRLSISSWKNDWTFNIEWRKKS